MALGQFYNVGTVTVTNGSTTVTGAGVIWSDVLIGDFIQVGPYVSIVSSVDATFTVITLAAPWAGTTASGAAYLILKMSWERYVVSITQVMLREFMLKLEDAGVFYAVEPGHVPDPAIGNEGDYALRTSSPWTVWLKVSGAWVVQAPPSGGSAPPTSSYDTMALAQAATIAPSIQMINIAGYYAVGDSERIEFKKVGGLPAGHFGFQSADGAWWQYCNKQYLSALSVGAKRDDSTDNQTFFNNWVNYCNAMGLNAYLPSGVYRHSNVITVPSGVNVYGDGARRSFFKMTHATNHQFNLQGFQYFRDIACVNAVARTGGINLMTTGNAITIQDFLIAGAWIGIQIDNAGYYLTIKDGTIDSTVGNGYGIVMINAQGTIFIDKVYCDGPATPLPYAQILMRHNPDKTSITDCVFNHARYCMLFDPGSGQNVNRVTVQGCTFEYGSEVNVYMAPGGSGAVGRSTFTDCNIMTGSQHGVALSATAPSLVEGITFNNCQMMGNTHSGVIAIGNNVKNLGINNCSIGGNAYGIFLSNVSALPFGNGGTRINSNRIGPCGGYGQNNEGLHFEGSTAYVYVEGNDYYGNVTNINNIASGANIQVNPNFFRPSWTLYHPPVDSGVGALGGIGRNDFYYALVGKTCKWRYQLDITNVGSAGAWIRFYLPFPAADYTPFHGMTGGAADLTGLMYSGSTQSIFWYYNGTFTGAGTFWLSGEYEILG
jgi:hypothetical protein